jgi:hypothetical protein
VSKEMDLDIIKQNSQVSVFVPSNLQSHFTSHLLLFTSIAFAIFIRLFLL